MNPTDAELIARLLEGRATPEERRTLMERADREPELLAVLADSAALVHEDVAAKPAWQRIASPRAWMAIAAVMVAAVVLPLSMRDRGIPAIDRGVLNVQAMATGAVAGAPLSTQRGDAQATRNQRSAALGARATDLDVLARAQHPAAATVALELASAARAIPGGAAAAARLEAAGANVQARAEALRAVASLMDEPRYRAGEWAEAVRLAAAAGAAPFLSSPALQRAVGRIQRVEGLSPEALGASQRLAAALGMAPIVPSAVEQAAAELLAALTR